MPETTTDLQEEYRITGAYDWVARAFRVTRRMLKLEMHLSAEADEEPEQLMRRGDIFLFNHFARFETFIPQYLMYERAGVQCRSIASPEFFNDERFGAFLRSVGVVPNDLPGLFPFLAREILHGRKLVIFPEGGMVKDKRVLDERGRFSIYSRSAMERRKQHRGAAVIALALDAFKTALLRDYSRGRYELIDRWAGQLGFADREALLVRALKPTLIVPAHITFYPLRVRDNLLYQAARLFNKRIDKRFAEELLIEGNLLLRKTDMDIRFARPLEIGRYWHWWEKQMLPNVVHCFDSLDELFTLDPRSRHWSGRIHAFGMRKKSNIVRDDYMKRMYQAVTVNLSHIASRLILDCVQQGRQQVPCSDFHGWLYLAIKRLQAEPRYHLHRSLLDPAEYAGLPRGESHRLRQFLEQSERLGLLSCDNAQLTLLDKLTEESGFDEIRSENPVMVYANEIAPLGGIRELLESIPQQAARMNDRDWADLRFDDEQRRLDYDRARYDKPRYHEINAAQTATADPRPFRLLHDRPAPGVVLVHGLLAAPAEMRPIGGKLHAAGFNVLGLRVPGHGTSPWDLRDRDWPEWIESVIDGIEMLRPYCPRVHLLGFSAGGLMALRCVQQRPDLEPASVVAVCAPVLFRERNTRWVPLLHQANRIARLLGSEGIAPFRDNQPEHPEINYAHIPIRAVYQLQKLIETFLAEPAQFACPATCFQADRDPVVKAESLDILCDHIQAPHKQRELIESERHGILVEDIGGSHEKIIACLQRQDALASKLTRDDPAAAGDAAAEKPTIQTG